MFSGFLKKKTCILYHGTPFILQSIDMLHETFETVLLP